MPAEQICPPVLEAIKKIHARGGTPFYLYDGDGIIDRHKALVESFSGYDFQQYFAVKALPSLAVLKLLDSLGSGFDCASITELKLITQNCQGPIMYSGNNVSGQALSYASGVDAEITIDDEAALYRLPNKLPKRLCLRVNFGEGKLPNVVGGDRPKFGIPKDRVIACVDKLGTIGVESVGLHCMETANSTDCRHKLNEALSLINLASEINESLLPVTLLNFAGGIGIPYLPGESAFNLELYSTAIKRQLEAKFKELPKIAMECGRFISGPHGYLVGQVIGLYRKPHPIIGVDITTSMIPRIMIYQDAYHHISFLSAQQGKEQGFDVVGSMCESADKLATQRTLPTPNLGDLCIVHDTGAHCIGMSNNYNGFLRPAEYMLHQGKVFQIVREETYEDYCSRNIFNEVD